MRVPTSLCFGTPRARARWVTAFPPVDAFHVRIRHYNLRCHGLGGVALWAGFPVGVPAGPFTRGRPFGAGAATGPYKRRCRRLSHRSTGPVVGRVVAVGGGRGAERL